MFRTLLLLVTGWTALGSAHAQIMTLEPNTPEIEVTLAVQVINGTAHGLSMVGDSINVQLYNHMELLDTLENTVPENGLVMFPHLPGGPRRLAVPRVRHGDMMFSGGAVPLTPDANGMVTSEVQVYDVSTDVNALSVGMHHMILEQDGQQLRCTEFFMLTNSSDTAISGAEHDDQGRPIVLRVGLPKGAQQLTPMGYLEKEAMVITPDGFFDFMAVPPGTHRVQYAYTIPLGSKKRDLSRTFYLPTMVFALLRQGATAQLHGLGEPDRSFPNAEGVPTEMFKRSNLRPGDRITFQIAGIKSQGSDEMTWIVLGLVFVGVGAVVLKRLLSSPGKSRPPAGKKV